MNTFGTVFEIVNVSILGGFLLKEEEKALEEHFGNTYQDYRGAAKRLILFIY